MVVLLLLLAPRVRFLIIIEGSGLHPEGPGTAFTELALVSERIHLRLVIVLLLSVTLVFGQFDVWPLRGSLVFFVALVYFWHNLYFIDVLLNWGAPNRLQFEKESLILGTWLL